MHTLKLFQMYDSNAMQVSGPLIKANRAEPVIRAFTDVLENKDTDPGRYPEDFSLLEVGEQNQDTGEIIPCDPKTIYTGRVWLRIKAGSSSPANTNGAGEQPPTLLEDPTGFIHQANARLPEIARRELMRKTERAILNDPRMGDGEYRDSVSR